MSFAASQTSTSKAQGVQAAPDTVVDYEALPGVEATCTLVEMRHTLGRPQVGTMPKPSGATRVRLRVDVFSPALGC